MKLHLIAFSIILETVQRNMLFPPELPGQSSKIKVNSGQNEYESELNFKMLW